MSQNINYNNKQPKAAQKPGSKDFFNRESGKYISTANLKKLVEDGTVSAMDLYTNYEVEDASADDAAAIMEAAIKKSVGATKAVNVQAIKDQAEAEAKTIKENATAEAQTIKDNAAAEAKTIKDQAEAEAKAIKAQATKDASKDPDKPAKKSKATATNLIAAGKIWKYVDDNGLVLVDMTGSQAKVDLISRINDKNIESKGDLEVFKKYGMSVELVPVRKLGNKLFVARKTADDFTTNTIADIITILNEEEED